MPLPLYCRTQSSYRTLATDPTPLPPFPIPFKTHLGVVDPPLGPVARLVLDERMAARAAKMAERRMVDGKFVGVEWEMMVLLTVKIDVRL